MRVGNKPRVLVSLCLMGICCRYDGRANGCEGLDALMARCELVPACPEQLGGLPTPRTPAERRGGRVVTRDGADVTEAFRRGAAQACALAERFGAKRALLKSKSPSCGAREIYDGTFTGTRVPGRGVAAEALLAMEVSVYGEDEIDRLLADLDDE